MTEKKYKMPAIGWLKMTDYMHGWLQWELGGAIRVKDQRVVSVQHLPGARPALRMETTDDMLEPSIVTNAMSATRYNLVSTGMTIDEGVVEEMYGVTPETLRLFTPIECPKLTLTKNGVLRPWSIDTCFSRKQASALQMLLRDAFWQAVGEFSERYAQQHQGERYAQEDMVEDFCRETGTSDIYVPAIRREWQRRRKRSAAKAGT